MTKAHPSLKAMAEDKELEGVSKETAFLVDPDLVIIEEGYNLREPGPELDEHLERMYVAMKAGEQFPPIDVIVRNGAIVVRRGHCRTLTGRRLKAEGLPIRLSARMLRGNDLDNLYGMIGENMGKGWSPLEMGRGFLRALSMGQTVAQIAARTGLHRSSIENGIALAEAPQAVQQMIGAGKVKAHTALKEVRAAKKAGDVNKATNKLLTASAANGGKKVTGKHLKEPKPRGQTLPPTEAKPALVYPNDYERLRNLAIRIAALSTVATPPRTVILELIAVARAIVGSPK